MLTTKEFIKKVEELGFGITNRTKVYAIYRGYGPVASVNKHKIFCVNTDYDSFYNLSKELQEKLYNLMDEYARTPLDKREEPQKFYLKFKLKTNYLDNFLNLNTTFDWFEINNKSNSDKFQTQFTQAEIDEIKEKFNVSLKDFEQIRVEEVEDEE